MTKPIRKKPDTISTGFIDAICARLAQSKRVRRTLPLNGRLHIDRQLPFLCVYRRPRTHRDEGTDRLVKGEASYLIASGSRRLQPVVLEMVQKVVTTLTEKFKAFLIIEIWSTPENSTDAEIDTLLPNPAFRILVPQVRPPDMTLEALENALKRIRIFKQTATVEVVHGKKCWPPGLLSLLPVAEARRLNCFVIGLEIQPFYRNPHTGEAFPFVLRRLHRGLARALKRAFFEFSHNQTTYRPANYQALGRRAVVKAVWEVDRQLAAISDAFDFLLQVTPVNTDQAWTDFKRQRCERRPVLHYRPLPVDPSTLKRKLFEIPVERVEDPTLAFLFREKRIEIDRLLSMLRDRETKAFLYGSLQLFGSVTDDLMQLATKLLQTLPKRSREDSRGGYLQAPSVAERARTEIEYYRQSYSALSSTVQIRDDTVGLMVSQGNLLVGTRARIPASRIEALLQHEVGTHVLTYFNGRAQPFQQLYSGLAGYDELQEGLAVLAEYLVGGLSRPRLRLLAGRVAAVHSMIHGATFVETFRQLHREHGFKQRTAFAITVRVYRGGGLTKDAAYLRGLVKLLDYLQEGGELEPLFVGKIAADHVPIIRELQARQVLRPTPLRPRFMSHPEIDKKLARLRNGVSVLNLIPRRSK